MNDIPQRILGVFAHPDDECYCADGTMAHYVSAGAECKMISATRGQRVGHEEYIQMVTRMACELGADLLKTDYSGDSTSFAAVVDAAFRPILIAGGPKTNTPREALAMVRGAIDAGASGMFIGRNVFQSDDPVGMMRIMRRIIHEGLTVDAALDELDTMVNRK